MQGLRSRLVDHGVAEALALLVLAQLEVQPEQTGYQACEPRLRASAAVERLAQLGQRWQEFGGYGVHHVLGVTLDHRHRRLHAIERLTLGGVGHNRDQITLAQCAHDALDLVPGRHAQLARRVDPQLGLLEELLDQPRDVRMKPRHAGACNLSGLSAGRMATTTPTARPSFL